jgi:hypothetical protein
MKTNFDDFIRTIPGVRIDEKEGFIYLLGGYDCFSLNDRRADSFYDNIRQAWNNLEESKATWYLEKGYIGDIYANWMVHFLLCWSGKQEEAMNRLRLRAKETYDNLMKGLERNRYFVCVCISSNCGSTAYSSVGVVSTTYPSSKKVLEESQCSDNAIVLSIVELNELDYNSFFEKDRVDDTKTS